MSAATNDQLQEVFDRLCDLAGVHIQNGSITIHALNGLAQNVNVNTTPWKRRSEDRRLPIARHGP